MPFFVDMDIINELYHRGVRRYQNADGSLTVEGEKRIRNEFSKKLKSDIEYDKKLNSELSDKGIIKNKKGVFLKKGSIVGRYSSNNHENISGNIYVYITDNDKKSYKNMASNNLLGFKNHDKIFNYKMKAISDLKIAEGKDVVDYLVKKHGDIDVKRLWKEYNTLDLRGNYDKIQSLSKNDETKWMSDYAKDVKTKVFKFVNNNLYKDSHINDDIIKEFQKKGYDAMIDAEDWSGGFDYPLIVFESDKNLKRL